eukprot:NODE_1433_length_1739_cov_49.812500_g1361_i0.p1 GENE.NODE_1433_length_1739_cov_49.812500_g1361_i0~~NODE_1433_length_1739_cov_49.812500_g1361_i0.p1  ORF type:complete len:522 (+),score=75.45 NODE_1433_length_1739_cov_49.812500_g1361_i0:62-1627(+)
MGCESKHRGVIKIRIRNVATSAVESYSVSGTCHMTPRNDLPLGELMATHVERCGLSVEGLQFLYNGIPITESMTPQSLGMKDNDIIDVVNTQVMHECRQKHFTSMNRLASTLQVEQRKMTMFNMDTLSTVLDYLDFASLRLCQQVCTHWHLITHRYALLEQLENGDFGCYSGTAYPEWLAEVGESTWTLMAEEAKHRAQSSSQWKRSGLTKEIKVGQDRNWSYLPGQRRPYFFTKAGGCTWMRTVVPLKLQDGEVEPGATSRFTLGIRHRQPNPVKTKVLAELESLVKPPSPPPSNAAARDTKQKPSLKPKKTREEAPAAPSPKLSLEPSPLPQAYPPEGVELFLAEARSEGIRNAAIDLFRKNFSPEMYFIFPLLVYQQNRVQLDFTDVQTHVMFGQAEDQGKVVGAVSWRMHYSQLTRQAAVLEVLFIAVWEQYRSLRYGSNMVKMLEAQAAKEKCPLFYVEIGHEQPLAQDFWGMNDFVRIHDDESRPRISGKQVAFIENNCLRFQDTQQWIKVLADE